MRRLIHSIKLDMRMQMKYGLYTVYIVIVAMYLLMLTFIPQNYAVKIAPIIIFSDPSALGFFFIGGLVLLEKSENVLDYIVVTPLRVKEYIISKVVSLSLISLVAALIISLYSCSLSFNIPVFIVTIILTSSVFTLIGFIAVSKFQSINEYLLSSMLYIIVLFIPFIGYFNLFQCWIFYIFPTHAMLMLLKGSFGNISSLNFIYSIAYLVLWIFLLYKLSINRFVKYIVLKKEVK